MKLLNSLTRPLLYIFTIISVSFTLTGCEEEKSEYSPDESTIEKAINDTYPEKLHASDLEITFQEVKGQSTFTRFKYPIHYKEDMVKARPHKLLGRTVIEFKHKKGDTYTMTGYANQRNFMGEEIFEVKLDRPKKDSIPMSWLGNEEYVIYDSSEYKKLIKERIKLASELD